MYEISRKGKSINTEIRLVIAGAGGRRDWEVTANGHGVSFWGGKDVQELDSDDETSTL